MTTIFDILINAGIKIIDHIKQTVPEQPSPELQKSSAKQSMQLSLQGVAEIVGFEGICTAPYIDSGGVWTFGIGHTRFDGEPVPEHMPRGVDHPLEEIFALFQNKIQRYVKEVNSAVKVGVTQAQFDALVSFHYNTGAIARATLTKALNEGAEKTKVGENFLNWEYDNGKKIGGLVSRREKEKKLFENGVYSNNGEAEVTTATFTGREMHARTINIMEFIK